MDYEQKARLLNSGLWKKVKKHDKYIRSHRQEDIEEWNDALEDAIFCNENNCTLKDLEDCRTLIDSNNSRVRRLNKRIEAMLLNGECIWLTLTFTDDVLAKTSEKTRRKYIQLYLKSQSNSYVANIDYGKNNEREHYHAVVSGDFVDMDKWIYGFAYTERIKNHLKTSVKLSKYVSKLVNHAVKKTTKRTAYIYSR